MSRARSHLNILVPESAFILHDNTGSGKTDSPQRCLGVWAGKCFFGKNSGLQLYVKRKEIVIKRKFQWYCKQNS